MRNLVLFSFAALALIFADRASFACPAKGTVFQDTFTDQSGGWEPDNTMSFGPSGLTWTLGPTNTNDSELNASFFAKDGDYCLDGVFPSAIPNTAYVGLFFWAVDYNNDFLFQVSSAGHVQLYRKANGTWINILDQVSPAVKTGPGAANEVRAVAKGNLVSLYVNGQKIADRRAQVPTATNLRFGLWIEIDSAAADSVNARTFHFKGYTVN